MSLVQPFALWPDADREMWHSLRKHAGPLDDPGALSHLRETSCETLQRRYGRWIKWLSEAEPEAVALPPAERATLPRLQRWLADLEHTKPMTRLMFIDGVLRILTAAAPDMDWGLQRRLKLSLKRAAGRGDPKRKHGRILSSDVLLRAGLSYANLDTFEEPNALKRMMAQRDGTMIALLALLPMRRRAFCELTLNQSVIRHEGGWLISLSEEMTKTGIPWEAAVPAQVIPAFTQYIEVTRPAFLARGYEQHDRLWIGNRGEMIEADYIGKRIGQLTLELTGMRIPPHFFRDAAATTLARMSPESARLIRPVLAHSSFKTAERHYIHAKTIEAGRDYQALLQRLKKGRT